MYVSVEPVGSVSNEESVFHWDELDDSFKSTLLPVPREAREVPDEAVPDRFSSGDLVKFTEYYRIRCHGELEVTHQTQK